MDSATEARLAMKTAETVRLAQLDARIHAVWSRRQIRNLLAGAMACFQWLVPLFLLCVLIDWATYMPPEGRIVMLLCILGVSFWQAWRSGWKELRQFNPMYAALQLESHYGNLQSLLISAIQLRSQPESMGSTSLREHTYDLAEAAAKNLHPSQAVPYKPLQRAGIGAAVMMGALALFAILNGPFLFAGVVRIFAPWIEIEYPTQTQISLQQGELVVREGDSAEVTATIAGVVPERATIYVRTGAGKARAIDLKVVESKATYTIASASRNFTYRVKAGDDRTSWRNVRVIPAPRIEKVAVELSYPEYLSREDQTVEALTLTVPEGTKLAWNLLLDRPVQSAKFIRDGEEFVDVEIGSDSKAISFTADVVSSKGYYFHWIDKEQGYQFTSPQYFLQVAADQAPRVELTSPASNLVAMLGRPLNLAVRVQDDHGVGSTNVFYRVNQHDEKRVELSETLKTGPGEHTIPWDYRETLPDLQIGDTVSFVIQVSDKYPGENGPHVVRSEIRRITFLSKEDYLAQINRQRDRLLSRVQTIYRQQRAAHNIVRTLPSENEGYLQACQLEAIRQEMIRDQLRLIAGQMQELLDDLAANGVADAVQSEALESVRSKLVSIAESHVARAAGLLREQSAQAASGEADGPAQSAASVNTAARMLGGLVLLRGIESAQEVYARECRMLAELQAELRWQTATADNSKQRELLNQRQHQLANWTDQLVNDLQSGMRYEKRPLAVLRLIRSVKDLRNAQMVQQLRSVGELIEQKRSQQAIEIQGQLVNTLLDAEFSVRLSGGYSTLLRARDLIEAMVTTQRQLIEENSVLLEKKNAVQIAQVVAAQTALQKQLLTLMLPTVPAPRANLFDEKPPQPPGVDATLVEASNAMSEALENLANGEFGSAQAQQVQAEQSLVLLLEFVEQWSLHMGLQSQGLSTLLAATSERMSRIEELEARTIGVLEKTDFAVADDKSVESLAEAQENLASDVGALIKSLNKELQSDQDQDLPPLISRIEVAERFLNLAVDALKDDDADQAVEQQEQAADALAEAYAIVVAQNERLALLQSMLMFQRSVRFAEGYMADIVAEQRDLLEATESSRPEEMKILLPQFEHMRACIHDVAPLLDIVAARVDVGTPLAFAKTDFEDAMIGLETEDKFEAVDAQDVAAESLAEVQLLVQDIGTQTGYLAEIVEYLHASISRGSVIAHEQNELKSTLLAVDQNDLQRFLEAQRALIEKAEKHSELLLAAAGNPKLVTPLDTVLDPTVSTEAVPIFSEPADEMQQASAALMSNDLETAADYMEGVTILYADNAEALLAVITMLHGLPLVEITSDTDPALVRLVDALALASEHKKLSRQTRVAEEEFQEVLGEQLRDVSARLSEITSQGETHPMLSAANVHLSDAVAAFSAKDREQLLDSQREADRLLRFFIIEQALILETAVPPPVASSSEFATDGPGSDSESEVTAGFIADFVSGEAPTDQRTEWKVFADRNRAALNQNFARELPLEYRGLLKNYYERVAK
jgi:hypothetical protein